MEGCVQVLYTCVLVVLEVKNTVFPSPSLHALNYLLDKKPSTYIFMC